MVCPGGKPIKASCLQKKDLLEMLKEILALNLGQESPVLEVSYDSIGHVCPKR
jgi:hypothetical protein